MRTLTLFFIALLLMTSCNKDNVRIKHLQGTWYLRSVKENISNNEAKTERTASSINELGSIEFDGDSYYAELSYGYEVFETKPTPRNYTQVVYMTLGEDNDKDYGPYAEFSYDVESRILTCRVDKIIEKEWEVVILSKERLVMHEVLNQETVGFKEWEFVR